MVRERTCCFSGHRPEKMPFAANANSYAFQQFRNALTRTIYDAIHSGYNHFITGMSRGMDLWAAQEVIAGGLSVRQTEALVKKLNAKPKTKKEADAEAVNYAKLAASELTDKLGRGCRIVAGKKKGRIELDYYGMDDLNDLLEALALIKKRDGGKTKA